MLFSLLLARAFAAYEAGVTQAPHSPHPMGMVPQLILFLPPYMETTKDISYLVSYFLSPDNLLLHLFCQLLLFILQQL